MTRYFPRIAFFSHLLWSSKCLKQRQLPTASHAVLVVGTFVSWVPLSRKRTLYNFSCVHCSPNPWPRSSGPPIFRCLFLKKIHLDWDNRNIREISLAKLPRKGKKKLLAGETIVFWNELERLHVCVSLTWLKNKYFAHPVLVKRKGTLFPC